MNWRVLASGLIAAGINVLGASAAGARVTWPVVAGAVILLLKDIDATLRTPPGVPPHTHTVSVTSETTDAEGKGGQV